jgi:hypothetical protein
MSLKQFLAVGRSVVGMRQDRSPYEMRAATLLPRFKPNPRTAVEKTDAKESVVPAKKNESSFLKRWNPFRKRNSAINKVNVEEEVGEIEGGDSKSGKSIFRKSFFPARGKKQGELAKPVRTLIQSELSLEAVRVVRNDLSDTDLEIVACFRQREAANAKAGNAELKTVRPVPVDSSAFAKAAAQPGWSRLTARLFDTGGIGRD